MLKTSPSVVHERIFPKGGTYVLLVADSLAERRTSMDLYAHWVHDALVASRDGLKYELLQVPVNAQGGQLALKWRGLRQRYWTIPRAIRSRQADIVHILDPAYGHLVPTAAPAPVVVSCHDLIPVESQRWRGSRKAFSPGWHLYKRAIGNLSKADAIVVPTAATKYRVESLLSQIGDKVWVIPYGVDEAFHKARWTRPQSILRVLHVGTNAAYKQIELVVDTVMILAARGHPVELVKAGPPLAAPLADRVTASGARLVQLGEVSNLSLPKTYSDATLLLFPSSREGFGLPVAEALAVGLPVVASKIDSLEEVSGGRAMHIAGEASSLADAVEALVNKPLALERMSAEGRMWAGRFRWEAHANSLRDVYTAVNGTKS